MRDIEVCPRCGDPYGSCPEFTEAVDEELELNGGVFPLATQTIAVCWAGKEQLKDLMDVSRRAH